MLIQNLRRNLQLKTLLPNLTTGLVIGIEAAALSVAFASMIFTGSLAPFLPIGITVLFVGNFIHNLGAYLGSKLPATSSGVQDSPAVIMAVTAVAIQAGLPGGSGEAKLYTTLAALILAGLLTGAICLLLGKFKLGKLVTYLPHPVMAGFLAGTGALLVLGALQVMTGQAITLLNPWALFLPGAWQHWLPGVVFGVVLFVLVMRVRHYLVIPGALAAALLLFYLALLLTGTPVAQAAHDGWLAAGLPRGQAVLAWWNPVGFAQVDWRVLLSQGGNLAACAVISLLSLLLNVTAIELSTGEELDLNLELKVSGLANLLGSAAGSVIGYPAIGDTLLAYRMGVSRLNSFLTALVIGLILVVGSSLLSYFPNLVLGGLLFFVGLDLLYAWLYKTWFSMSRLDYAFVVLIMLLINTAGFLTGVGVGLGLAIVLFVVQYSRTPAIRHTLSGVSYQSTVDRPRLYNQLLRRKGDWLYILELQGYFFFGTANQVLEDVRARLSQTGCAQTMRFIILDFRLVKGLDASAAFSFAKLKRLVQQHNVTLALTHLKPGIQRQLQKALPEGNVQYFSDLDHGIEWCEDQLVATFEGVGLARHPGSLFQQLSKALPHSQDVEVLKQYLHLRQFEPGACIIHQGSAQRGLYMIEKGQVRVQLECDDGDVLRLRTLGAGTFFGEMGLYSGDRASATVIAEQPTSIYELLLEDLERLEQAAPPIAAALHRFVAAYMSERLAKMTSSVQTLLR